MELIRRVTLEDCAPCLSSWEWLGEDLGALTPRFATAFGDLFLEGADGGYWFLDGVEGSLSRFWDSGVELQAALNTPGGQDQFLMVGLAQAASHAGLAPSTGQVLAFRIPPVLGGELAADNLEVDDLVVAVSISGQIHHQVRDLPPGASVAGFELHG